MLRMRLTVNQADRTIGTVQNKQWHQQIMNILLEMPTSLLLTNTNKIIGG